MGTDHCVECSRVVTAKQHALACDHCNSWQHRVCNTGISQTDYRRMMKNGTDISFVCSKCRQTQEENETWPAESTHIDQSADHPRSGSYGTLNISVITTDSDRTREAPVTEVSSDKPTDAAVNDSSQPAHQHQHDLTGSFDITRREVEDSPEIAEDSIQEPGLLDTILEVAPVSYTLVELGSQRNRVKLVSNDRYKYTKKVSKGEFTYWRCSKRSKLIKCTATVSQKGSNFFKNSRPHIHQADKGALKKVIVRKEVKASALQYVHHPARQIVEDVLLNNIQPDDHNLPKVNNLKRLANRVREHMRPDEPRTLDFEVDREFLQCYDFLIGDLHVETARHLVFATSSQLQVLKNAKRWFCDGTFKIVSLPFEQMWSIHAFIRKGDSIKQVPLVFYLMSRRKTKDYVAVFQKLKEVLPGVPQVQGFVTDFEKGAWKAVRQEFPDALIKGCAFHFNQAIWRKTQELGLKTTYDMRGPEYRYIRSLMALPFLPAADIQPVFDHLEQKANSTELQQLVRYIHNNWLTNPVWHPRNWNIFQHSIRTNNDVEGWHTRINKDAGKANLTFYLLVPLLQREASIVAIQQRLVGEEHILREQRSRHRDNEGRLHQFWAEYSKGEINASKLLKKCAHIYGPTND